MTDDLLKRARAHRCLVSELADEVEKLSMEVSIEQALRAQVNVCSKHSEAILGGADCWCCRAEKAEAEVERLRMEPT